MIAKVEVSVAAIGSSGIRWTRRPGVKWSTWGMPAALPAWLPPETRTMPVSGPQPLALAGAERFGDFVDQVEAGVGAPVADAAPVVVAVWEEARSSTRPSGPIRIWTPSQSS